MKIPPGKRIGKADSEVLTAKRFFLEALKGTFTSAGVKQPLVLHYYRYCRGEEKGVS